MVGNISLSLEREPNFFADANLPGEEKQTIIAREGERLVCVGSCTVRQRLVNGDPRCVGYLGGLRLDASVAGRFDILRRGYEFFRELQAEAPADFYFTSIAADNVRARQFLERGLRGMPRYEFVGEFVTLVLPVARRSSFRRVSDTQLAPAGSEGGTPLLADLLNSHGRHFQFAPHWTADELHSLKRLGLSPEDFQTLSAGNQQPACAALWDQRGFKQAVIRGYARRLALARPLLNFAARLLRRPGLPAPGATLAHATLSHLASASDNQAELRALVRSLMGRAAQRRIEFLTVGLAANDPRLTVIREHFRGREYLSRLYVVRWPGLGGAAGELDGSVLQPELALL